MAILVIVDSDKDAEDSQEVVRVGADMARAYEEELIALTIVSNDEFLKQQQGKSSMAKVEPDPIERYENEAADRAKALVDQVSDESLDVSYMGRVAEPADGIIKAGQESDARFIVIGARKQSPVGKAIFGSTTQSVLLGADRPVVTVLRE